MMEDQLVSFKTAKLAKEKGFDWYCYDCYESLVNNDYILHSLEKDFADLGPNLQILKENWNGQPGNSNFNVSAPTQSLLQKWLREKYKIHIEIKIYSTPEFEVVVCSEKTWDEKDEFVKMGFVTYEEALEVGLQKALELI